MLAMQILVLVMLWALVVVMAQMVGRVGMTQKVGMVGMVGGCDGCEGRDGCEKERMLLDHRTRTLAPGVISTISTSGDLLVFWLTTVMLLKFL
jgi:hypothetical protein